jgi:hypothetical protein
MAIKIGGKKKNAKNKSARHKARRITRKKKKIKAARS